MAWLLGLVFAPWVAVPRLPAARGAEVPAWGEGQAGPAARAGCTRRASREPPRGGGAARAPHRGRPGRARGKLLSAPRHRGGGIRGIAGAIGAAARSIDLTVFMPRQRRGGRRHRERARGAGPAGVAGSAAPRRVWGHDPILPRAEREVRAAGGEVRSFMPLIHAPVAGYGANLRSHRKIAVFGRSARLPGGMNMALEYRGPRRGPGAGGTSPVWSGGRSWRTRLSSSLQTGRLPARRRSRSRSGRCRRRRARGSSSSSRAARRWRPIPSTTRWSRPCTPPDATSRGVTPYYVPDDVVQQRLRGSVRGGALRTEM
jgi:hypothetical protein